MHAQLTDTCIFSLGCRDEIVATGEWRPSTISGTGSGSQRAACPQAADDGPATQNVCYACHPNHPRTAVDKSAMPNTELDLCRGTGQSIPHLYSFCLFSSRTYVVHMYEAFGRPYVRTKLVERTYAQTQSVFPWLEGILNYGMMSDCTSFARTYSVQVQITMLVLEGRGELALEERFFWVRSVEKQASICCSY